MNGFFSQLIWNRSIMGKWNPNSTLLKQAPKPQLERAASKRVLEVELTPQDQTPLISDAISWRTEALSGLWWAPLSLPPTPVYHLSCAPVNKNKPKFTRKWAWREMPWTGSSKMLPFTGKWEVLGQTQRNVHQQARWLSGWGLKCASLRWHHPASRKLS